MHKGRLNLVITGHVDHGKSTLIGRLLFETKSLQEGLIREIKSNLKGTGIKMEFAHIMDYYEEERIQERTIDTTQFHFNIKDRRYVIIDTPGHKEFIKNMMTGSSQADAAVLIISAKEGVQEQTKRHAYILKMLGVKQIIVVINKMDLIDYSQDIFGSIKDKAKEIIGFLNINPNNIIPVSAQQGDNISSKSKKMSWYKGISLVNALKRLVTKQQLINFPLRFPIQDVYNVKNKKIVVGKVVSGIFKVNEEVVIYPDNIKSRVKSIEVFNKNTNSAQVGQSIGLVLEDGIDIKRGQVICDAKNLPFIQKEIEASVFWFSERRYNEADLLTIKCATFEGKCKINRIEERIDSSTLEIIEKNSRTLEETQAGKVIISIEKSMVIEDFNSVEDLGRFVLLRDNQVCAGGIITER